MSTLTCLSIKDIKKLRPNVSGEGFSFDSSQDCRNVELFGDLCQQNNIVDESCLIDIVDAKRHLRLVINEYNHRVFWRKELLVFVGRHDDADGLSIGFVSNLIFPQYLVCTPHDFQWGVTSVQPTDFDVQ